jgi:hypothetical protein
MGRSQEAQMDLASGEELFIVIVVVLVIVIGLAL